MSVSISAMGIAELAAFLVANGSFPTVTAAMEALNIVILDGVGAAGTAISITGGAGEFVVGTAGQTAIEVAAQAELAATGTNVTTAGIGLLQGEAATSSAAILGLDLGIAAAACAPLLGVSLGATLYETNPELWTAISQKLLPFCYPGTTKIPTWAEIVDGAWKTSVPKKIIDALKELFTEEGVGPQNTGTATDTTTGTEVPFTTSPLNGEVIGTNWSAWETITLSSGKIVWTGSDAFAYAIDTVPMVETLTGRTDYGSEYTQTYNNNNQGFTSRGTPYYWMNVVRNNVPLGHFQPLIRVASHGVQLFADAIIDGIIHQNSYPTGTSEWTGNTPEELPQSKPSVIGIDSTTGNPITQPMVPISPPVIAPYVLPQPQPLIQPQIIPFPWPEPETPGHTVPWPTEMPWPLPNTKPDWWPSEIPYPYKYPTQYPTQDPEVQPDPTTITQPDKQVQPYVQPLPLPYEIPSPEPDDDPDPYIDPTLPLPPPYDVPTDPPIVPLGPDPIGVSPWPDMPNTPPPFSQGGGIVTVYHPTPSELYAFQQWLWVTYADATIDKIFNNPFDGVISLFELYCTPTDIGTNTIKSGFLDSGINSAVISRYTEIDCGTLGIPEYYGNYLDYSPYSQAHIYLPFIGIVDLNVDDIVGHAVNVTYRIDEYNGSCIAMITVAKVTEVNGEEVEYSNTMYQFAGNCSVEVPLSGGSQAAIKAGMMQANAYQNAVKDSVTASIIGGIASVLTANLSGGISAAVSGASEHAYGQANYLSNMLSGKSIVQKSGTFGSSHGAMGIKTPFITITRPKQIRVPNYNELYGYPAHKMVYVGDCKGFIRCREVHVDSPTASDKEKSLIESLLKAGVFSD